MALLQVTNTHDFRPDSLDPDITGIVFQGAFVATFDQAQFGTGKIANNVEISGGGFGDEIPTIEVFLTPGGIGFSAALWTKVPGGIAEVRLVGGETSEIITGSNDADNEFLGGGGDDTLTGGDGDDTFIYAATGDVEAGESIDGKGDDWGYGSDTISIRATNDFRGAAITDIEAIELIGDGTVASFTWDQLRVPFDDFVDKNGMIVRGDQDGTSVQTLVVHVEPSGNAGGSGGIASLRYYSFYDWGEEDQVLVEGAEGDDILVGSDIGETIRGAAGKDSTLR